MRRWRLPLVGLIAAIMLATGVASAATRPTSPRPMVSFSQLPRGWHQLPAQSDHAAALALSWRYKPDSGGWANSMPRDGIAITVWFFPKKTPRFPPLNLAIPRSPATTLEGAPDTPEYRIRGRVNGHDVEVWVDIRRPHPTQRLLRLAQQAVSALRFK